MSQVHTEYGPGRIIDQETVRGRTQYKVAGAGFEVWVDQTKLAWAPLDSDNSTELPYNPDPQHDAIGTFGDDDSSTIQPIHHIDADERLTPSDSITFEEGEDSGSPEPDGDLFAKHAFSPHNLVLNHPRVQQIIRDQASGMAKSMIPQGLVPEKAIDWVSDKAGDYVPGHAQGYMVGHGINMVNNHVNQALDAIAPGSGWGDLIKSGSHHEANPAALALPLLRTVGPALIGDMFGGGGDEGGAPAEGGDPTDMGGGWGELVKDAYARPAGLSDKFIDITAGADYHNNPVAQFRHDPDAYINRIGHLMDEGLNPRFAEYMDLVEADSSIRTAAWKDVRAKAMRLKRDGHVTVKDLAPNRIMASVVGDHGTYDVLILKNGSFGGLGSGTGSHAISNWHCACEWGKWAFRRKFTYVGRLCSHAYASYLTMQSSHLTNQPRQTKRPTRAPKQDRGLTFPYLKGGSLRTADNLQNGPERLTPEMVVNDTDDAHTLLDVTKDERTETGPDDVVSDKDIVHFARMMRDYEVAQRPYPRELVAFLARYASESDDVPSDYRAPEIEDSRPALDTLRSDAHTSQEGNFGSMADEVHRIQDAVEDARSHGVDADRFVAMVRKVAEGDGDQNGWKSFQDGGRTVYRQDGNSKGYSQEGDKFSPVNFNGRGDQGPEENRYEMNGSGYQDFTKVQDSKGRDLYRGNNPWQKPEGFAVNPDGAVDNVLFDGQGQKGDSDNRYDLASGDDPVSENFQNFLKNNPGAPAPAPTPQEPKKTGPEDSGSADKPGVGGQPDKQPGAGGAPGAAPAPGGGGYTPPGGGQTSGTIADGGVAGAENGDNSAITKSMLDADGNYTVKGGETWSDIAQRTTGDMNNYQKMFDQQKGGAGSNIDSLAEGTKINLKDFANDTGNNGVRGDVTNPGDGGADKDIATVDSVNTSAPAATTDAVTPPPAADTSAVGSAAADGVDAGASLGAPAPAPNTVAQEPTPAPTPTAGQEAKASLRTARDWLRWAAEGDGSTTSTSTTSSGSPGAAPAANPATDPSASATPGVTTPAQPNTSATSSTSATAPGTPTASDMYDPEDPSQAAEQESSPANPGSETTQSGGNQFDMGGLGGGMGGGMSGMGDMLGQGLGAATDIASGLGDALPGIVDMAGSIASGIGSIFASRQDFDDWVRYAYPAGGGDDYDPKTLPHIPFNGSGNPGPLDYSTSEEYADKARKGMDDVTDLGSGDLTKSMGEWQKQGAYHQDWTDERQVQPADRSLQDLRGRSPHREDTWRDLPDEDEDGDPYREASIGYSTADDSDIVRSFQASLGETVLGQNSRGSSRFDDIAGAAQGFLRTAGRHFSLAEQSELIREGDKGGARNLDSLNLAGTHYEDMNSLGW